MPIKYSRPCFLGFCPGAALSRPGFFPSRLCPGPEGPGYSEEPPPGLRGREDNPRSLLRGYLALVAAVLFPVFHQPHAPASLLFRGGARLAHGHLSLYEVYRRVPLPQRRPRLDRNLPKSYGANAAGLTGTTATFDPAPIMVVDMRGGGGKD